MTFKDLQIIFNIKQNSVNVVSKNPFEETTRTNFNHVKTEKVGQKAGN